MARHTFGSTTFEVDSWEANSRIKVITAEGSAIAVPCEDLCRFFLGAFILPQRQIEAEMRAEKDWRKALLG